MLILLSLCVFEKVRESESWGERRGEVTRIRNVVVTHPIDPNNTTQHMTVFSGTQKLYIQRNIHHPLVSTDVRMFETMIHYFYLFFVMFYRMSWMTLHRLGMHTPSGHQRTSVTPVVGPV